MKTSPFMFDGTEIVPMLDSDLALYLAYHSEMASRSYLFALGPFSDKVVDFLEYSTDEYEGTNDGVLVATRVFNCKTTSESTDMAIAVGVELDNFNTHMVKMPSVDLVRLKEMFDPDETTRFVTLAMNNFNFMFMPDK